MKDLFILLRGGLECVGHSFAYVAYFVFLSGVLIQTQRAAVANRCVPAQPATHLPYLATHLPELSHPSPYLATHLPDLATHLPL